MKRFILAACAGVLAVAMATPSSAADLPRPAYKAPVFVGPGFTWSGFYVGLNTGYAWGKSDWSSSTTTAAVKPKGWLAGGTLGYNLQTGVWVWGLEGDFDYADIKDTKVGTGVCAGATGCQTKVNWLATARGRIGYAWGDRWLPYITGGAAFGAVKMTPNSGTSETDTRVGWTLGGGLEYAFLGAWSIKGEYLYVDLGKSNCSSSTCITSTDVTFKSHVARAGLNYRF